ncbi:MAG: SufD family Fe-S cluster assembly protein [Rhodobacteraceae bacterium]|nr:MAG: SufD family Fe-S cluster assembly protein [Paracoccaceae bacterium]
MIPRAKLVQQKRDAAVTWLDGRALPEGGVWATKARKAAEDRLRDMGMPSKRDEYWRYTDPRRLTESTVQPAVLHDTGDALPLFDRVDRVKLVFVDGVFDAEASDAPELAGAEISQLRDAARSDLHWARDIYGVLEARGQTPISRPLASLNTAFATNGVLIRVAGKAPRPLALIYRRSQDTADALMHHVIRLDAGAELTLLEDGPVAARYNQVTEIDLGEGAVLNHIRAQGRDHERVGATHLFARLGAKAQLKSFTLSANGALTRNEAVIWLDGSDGTAHIAGACVGDGAFHHDDTVFVNHAAPRCESRQVYKKVLRHGAVGVFQGKILVDQIAQLTDGYQISQSLLLNEDAQFLAKPELEIYADDVKCSHGSTSGEIDANQFFYLRARGVPEAQARMLLVLAFLAEALDEIDDHALAAELRDHLEAWLNRRT